MKFFFMIFSFSVLLFSCKKNESKVATKGSKTDTILQKNGVVLTYSKPVSSLTILKRDQTQYSENYQKRIRKIAEYYIENSRQNLINFHKNKPESKLGFSIEENDWEDVNYTQIGIFNKSGSNISTLQWLFYEPQSQQLYEFDLNKKQLTVFNLK